MNCPSCGTPNIAGARFCMKCGNSLNAACALCSAPLPQGAAFCPSCGQKVGAPASAAAAPPTLQRYIPAELLAKLEYARNHGGMRGERRTVTILFCDVKGSTAAAEKLDPEEWAEIMNGGFECLIAPVFRYEGTLARLMGDAILAFFGAPIAHEDDPQRAVLAALEIQQEIEPYRATVRERWGIDFNVRAGINTGLVVVGEVGSDLRMEYTALGDAVNLAARMEQTAQPGTIQITQHTHRLIAPLFEFEPLGPMEVKGRTEPVNTYRVLRPRATPGQLRGLAGLDAPLIGRQKEFDTLMHAVAKLRAGRGQIVSVVGEAGVGKSRLITEFKREVMAQAEAGPGEDGNAPSLPVTWHEGRSYSYETSTPYAPFIDLLRDCFGLAQDEATAGQYVRVREQVGSIAPDRVQDISPFLGSMLQLPLEGDDLEKVRYLPPPMLRAQVFRSTCEFFGRLAATRPVVLVFEDVHWIDSASLELVEHLLPVTENAGLMVLAAFRPQRQDPSWRVHELASREYEHRYTAVQLEPLDADDTRTLVNTLLHVEGLPDRVRNLILQKSEGNPFFVEEVIRSLIDSGSVKREDGVWRATREIADLAVPDTIAGVITARLDRLNEEARPVVQTASVVGREFQYDVLAEVLETTSALDGALVDLQRRGLVREKARLPVRMFMFKHALTQETVYSTLLLSRRRELHRRVAGFYERTDPVRAAEIARHYLEARAFEQAVPWLVEAGDHAARAYSIPEAIDYYSKALEHVEPLPEIAYARRAFEGLAGAYVFGNDPSKAMAVYDRMLEFAQKRNDRPMQVSALNKSGFAIGMRMGQLPEAERRLAVAEKLARDCQDYPGLIELHITHCFINVTTGRFSTAMDHLSQSAQLGKDLGIGPARLMSLTHISTTLTLMRRFDDAWATAQEARQLAIDIGHREHLAELMAFPIAVRHIRDGDFDTAARSAEDAASLASTIRAASPEADAALVLGMVNQARGDYEKAIEWHERGIQAAKMAGFPFVEAIFQAALASDLLQISTENRSKALELHDRSTYLMNGPLGGAYGAMVQADMGFGLLALGAVDKAEECFERGIRQPSAPMYIMEPVLLAGQAIVRLAQGNLAEASDLVGKARGLVEQYAMKNCVPLVAFVSGKIEAANSRPEDALRYFDEAASAARAMGMLPLLWQARAGASACLAELGRRADADAARQEARTVIAEIASRFRDATLRDQYIRGNSWLSP
ncbi:MAG: AAA family ATPase [Chloroflexi bacterium]|nr:AAA family ATPase [Chloroflexota bacterium]